MVLVRNDIVAVCACVCMLLVFLFFYRVSVFLSFVCTSHIQYMCAFGHMYSYIVYILEKFFFLSLAERWQAEMVTRAYPKRAHMNVLVCVCTCGLFNLFEFTADLMVVVDVRTYRSIRMTPKRSHMRPDMYVNISCFFSLLHMFCSCTMHVSLEPYR